MPPKGFIGASNCSPSSKSLMLFNSLPLKSAIYVWGISVTHSSQWRYIRSSMIRAVDFFRSGYLSAVVSPYFTFEIKAIFFSSGEITNPLTPFSTAEMHFRLLPSASIVNSCILSPSRAMNAIFLPSQINVSFCTLEAVVVRRVGLLPSAFIIHNSRLLLFKAMFSYDTP